MARPLALVAGASGLIGRRVAQRLREVDVADVLCLARRPPQGDAGRWLAVDLTDAADCRRKLGDLGVTHLLYTARYDHPEGTAESVEINAGMLSNVVQALPRATLAHVHVVHGSKYYGHQLGPVALPMREDGPRAAGGNFYFEQEDFLQDRSREEGWGYTISRPHTFCDPGIDMPRSIGLLVAVYAAIQRELGLPLDFPGAPRAYAARTQFTDIGLLARAVVWMATEPRCANQAFNVVNGDCPRWSELWPRFAEALALDPGRALGIDLGQYMADKAPVWRRVIRRHGLRETDLHELVLWPYGNYVFKPEWDIMSSTQNLRACGFQDSVDSAAMFERHFDGYRAAGIVPQPGDQ